MPRRRRPGRRRPLHGSLPPRDLWRKRRRHGPRPARRRPLLRELQAECTLRHPQSPDLPTRSVPATTTAKRRRRRRPRPHDEKGGSLAVGVVEEGVPPAGGGPPRRRYGCPRKGPRRRGPRRVEGPRRRPRRRRSSPAAAPSRQEQQQKRRRRHRSDEGFVLRFGGAAQIEVAPGEQGGRRPRPRGHGGTRNGGVSLRRRAGRRRGALPLRLRGGQGQRRRCPRPRAVARRLARGSPLPAVLRLEIRLPRKSRAPTRPRGDERRSRRGLRCRRRLPLPPLRPPPGLEKGEAPPGLRPSPRLEARRRQPALHTGGQSRRPRRRRLQRPRLSPVRHDPPRPRRRRHPRSPLRRRRRRRAPRPLVEGIPAATTARANQGGEKPPDRRRGSRPPPGARHHGTHRRPRRRPRPSSQGRRPRSPLSSRWGLTKGTRGHHSEGGTTLRQAGTHEH
mmetsp:Transcript_13959/g.45561  ORF Transcript_13959/g.45561 Transcript_13959/m.45561 type:complete len:448 (-) Transcript_13959:59-1402(-)